MRVCVCVCVNTNPCKIEKLASNLIYEYKRKRAVHFIFSIKLILQKKKRKETIKIDTFIVQKTTKKKSNILSSKTIHNSENMIPYKHCYTTKNIFLSEVSLSQK